jgi:hypothetical protein
MDRRAFLGKFVGGVAVAAAVRTWPFRVFSFPKEIVIPQGTMNFIFARPSYRQLEREFYETLLLRQKILLSAQSEGVASEDRKTYRG